MLKQVAGRRAEGDDTSSVQGMELLIPVINKLQEVFNTTGTSSDVIKLPQIVVVGDQSSGKSSVLESLVGKPFLPRGKGIVTRCPIVLKLIHTLGADEWCEFMHEPGKQYHNFKDVEKEIISQTERLAGTNFGITKDKIQITVYSPDVVTLTLVDLPGIVKNPTGDQPEDIETQIRSLINEFIQQPNSIILAVSSANNDIATSESLKMAKEVDPNKERTLAVFTKLDLGLDATDVLTGRLIPMKLGIVGVVNRNQEEIEGNKSIQDAILSERNFLRSKYPTIASQHGTPYLATRLNKILMQHIEYCFPSLDMRIKELTATYKTKLDDLGNDVDLNDEEKMQVMVDILDKFVSTYKGHIDGRGRFLETTALCGGARIDFIFENTFDKNLSLLSPLQDVTDMEIMIAVRNSRGVGNRQFIPEDAFQILITRQIRKMKEISIHCANLVHQEMINIIPKCLDPSNQRFPKVNAKITHVVNELLQRRAETAKQMLEFYIDGQSAAAITADADFHKEMAVLLKDLNVVGLGDLPVSEILKNGSADTILTMAGAMGSTCNILLSAGGQTVAVDGSQKLTEEQVQNCTVVKKLMDAFFQIVRKQVRDYVTKCLLHFLVYFVVDNVYKDLLRKLHSVDAVADVIKESETVAMKRKMIKTDLEALYRASEVLDEVRENAFL